MRYAALLLLLLGSVSFAQDSGTRELIDELTQNLGRKYHVEYVDRGDDSYVAIHSENDVYFHLTGANTPLGEKDEPRRTTEIVEIYETKMTQIEYVAVRRKYYEELDVLNKWEAKLSGIRREPRNTGMADDGHRLLMILKPANDQEQKLADQFRAFLSGRSHAPSSLPTHEYKGHLYRVASMVSDYPGMLDVGDLPTVATARSIVCKTMTALP